jgi:hypothetical protein
MSQRYNLILIGRLLGLLGMAAPLVLEVMVIEIETETS